MKGVIFKHLESFVCETFGMEFFEELLEGTTLQTEGPFLGPGTYPDEDLLALVGTLLDRSGLELGDALFTFGRYLFDRLTEGYPEAVSSQPDLKTFLLTVESVIHVEVKKLFPGAITPKFEYDDPGGNRLVMRYFSERRLCPLFRGTAAGCLRSLRAARRARRGALHPSRRRLLRIPNRHPSAAGSRGIAVSEELLRKRLARAEKEIQGLEQLIEEKSRTLFVSHEREKEASQLLRKVMESMNSALMVIDGEERVSSVNPALCDLVGCTAEDVLGRRAGELLVTTAGVPLTHEELGELNGELALQRADGTRIPILYAGSRVEGGEGPDGGAVVGLATDLRAQKKREVEMRHAQKMESIGQLAAGISHELNTPIQFIGDSLAFIEDGVTDLAQLLGKYRDSASVSDADRARFEAEVVELEDQIDLPFLLEQLPESVGRANDGVRRVAGIVRAMKEFAHPGGSAFGHEDLNAAVRRTLTVARNEYKYIADVETDLGDLPEVPCRIGDVSQVLLNLVVNAAHAIEDRTQKDERGLIRIRTFVDGEYAALDVEDDGKGIPEKLHTRVFDPFFTTKEVGRGSGQGLALARSVIVDKHGGQLTFQTVEGVGTTFHIRLPLERKGHRDAA